MLKIARRTAQAEKQAARRQKVRERALDAIHSDRVRSVRNLLNEEIQLQARQARRARRETWTMGPLAPQRNHAGATADEARRGRSSHTNRFGGELFAEENLPHWGTLSIRRLRNENTSTITPREANARCAWAGSAKTLCLAVGDRCVVVEGPFKGAIGPIKDIRAEQGTLTLEGVARTNITVPSSLVTEAEQSVHQIESAIPIDAVRLVHPLTDPATGKTRDVIVRELRPVGFYRDRPTHRSGFSRIVPGLNVRIPWPRTAPAEHEDQDGDTLRIYAEQVTFVPTLLRPPAPETVLDELRNRYSRFRTRHTPEYVAAKEAEEAARQEAKKYGPALVKGKQPGLSPPGMRTPLEEFHIQQKALRRARGQPELSDDMLEQIGRLMAQSKITALNNAGMSEVPPSDAQSTTQAPQP
ncbi:kow motif domain containing protein [Sporothrix brasiliensis 5110]|uniref:Kow motif domain containing protein n=1 Tax=Sporothrix brasiliensis 5110 TaxID=1398154 RepID=A0A0C2J3F9_9PEZI|nr:kow motif domain containing protein [Sporothrix brasiliensis 5110]KIH91592.1 kow motif domain containing protein [Sporothrix brasiliensis 5110]